jgi:signal transduction histidine kinase
MADTTPDSAEMASESAKPPTPAQKIAAGVRRLVFGRNSLVGRLIRLAAVWFILALLVTGIGLTAYFSHAALVRFQLRTGEMTDTLVADTNISSDGEVSPPPYLDPRAERFNSGLYWQITEIGPKGQLTDHARSRSLWNVRIATPPDLIALAKRTPGLQTYFDTVGQQGEPVRAAAIYFSTVDNRHFLFLAAEDRRPMDKDINAFAWWTAGALIALALGSLAAIFVQVRIGLRPLFDLTDEISHIQGGEQQRLLKVYPAEIKPVARQINAFLDDAQETMERQRMHVGNLAHALKTPLSVLLSAAGEETGGLPETVRKQTEAMRGHVDHHLRRARAAARAQNLGERTPVEPVLDELAVLLEQVFQDKGVVIDWRAPETLAFRGEKQDFQEIAGNLLENACIWCKRRVRAVAEFVEDGQVLSLAIEDDGPGLDPSRYDEVLKRGARLDESRPGTGLGLSIVDELVRAYGGKLVMGASAWGGLRVEVRLPGKA